MPLLAEQAKAEGKPTWDTASLQRDFEVVSFMAPFVVVRERASGRRGTMTFSHSPRVYFDFQPEGS